MNDFNSADYIEDIKSSNMFGLEKDCTFEGISSESEGISMVKKTIGYLWKNGHKTEKIPLPP